MNWLIAQLREPSTWRGLVWLLTALGVSLSPEAWQYITTAGMALAGLIGCVTAENAQRVEIQLPPIELLGRAADPAERLRQPVPAEPDAEPDRPDVGFNG